MKNLQLEPKHFEIICSILKKAKVTVYVFGSRTKNNARAFSDLDLCLKADYDKTIIRKLQDDFEDSDLPFKVDIVVWSELSENFKKQIENDLVLFNCYKNSSPLNP